MKLHNFDFSKKIFYHPENIVKFKEGKRPFPITMEVDLTNRCNHRCSFCFYAEHIAVDKSMLNTEIINKALTDAKTMGLKGVSFTGGGEPMVHKEFVKVLKHARAAGLDCGLITNGSAINASNVQDLVTNLKWIRISMGGGNRESYKYVQGVDHFDRVMENIKMLSRLNSESGQPVNIGVRVLVTEQNLGSLLNLANELTQFKINYLQLAPDMFTKDEGKFWNDNKTQGIFRDSESILQTQNIKLLTAGYLKEQPRLDYPEKCYAHFFQVAVTAEGDVIFCKNARGAKDFIIGNINENTLEEIWNGEKNKSLEKWIKPSNCGLLCKNMQLNVALQDTLHPSDEMSPNFIS
jgi:radical SAM protein with 4Fe4S-binding SPASM domain